jgi:hypothetical protein
MRFRWLSRTSVLASTGFVLLATAAVAGSGVGGVFNLGRVNTVNATTQLRGTVAGQQLSVLNSATSTSSTAIFGQTARGVGVRGVSTAASGVNYGVFATTASPSGFAGYFRNTGSTTNPRIGRGIRVLGAGGTGSEFPSVNYAGAGEFAGPNGVVGYSTFAGGAGVGGFTGTKGNIGIYGVSTNEAAYAGLFRNFASSTDPLNKGTGIRALGAGATGNEIPSDIYKGGGEFIGPHGVVAVSSYAFGAGVMAIQGIGNYAVLARGYSVWDGGVAINGPTDIDGDLDVVGALTKGSGSFKIDHPLDPENKYLYHSFVESPDMMNIYSGNVVTDAEGEAIVELPDYFEALNRDPRYQLTVIGSPANAYVLEEVQDNTFSIKTSEPGVKVSWQVTGNRQDAYAKQHPIIVEEEKAVVDRGRFLHPTAFGKPEALAIGDPAQQIAEAN